MTPAAPPSVQGLYRCGRLRNAEGAPLRPGGLALTEELVALAGFAAGDVVADIGCGLGASTQFLHTRGIRGVGVDIDRLAGDRTPFVVADAAQLPFADASLDGLMAECVLSTLANPARALAEWRRALRPGGRLALSDVYSRAAGGGWPTREKLCQRLAATGFRVESFEDRSEALKRFVAEFIFAHGSLDALCGGGLARAALVGGRPGYALMIARQTEGRIVPGDSDV